MVKIVPTIVMKWFEAGLDMTNLDVVKVVTIVSYLLTFVVGFTGNTLVLYVVGRFPVIRRKSVANYYIWNLALADELYVLALPLFCWATYRSVSQRFVTKARFPLPELTGDRFPLPVNTGRVDGRAFPLAEMTARQLGPLTRAVNSGSGNRA